MYLQLFSTSTSTYIWYISALERTILHAIIMDGILICLETVRQELVTKDNSTRTDSTYPKFSAEFAEVLKETLKSEFREKNNTGFGLYTMNEEEKNSVQKSETEGNGLLKR